jgi:tetratricopeptide (TPR) repeat protein
MGPYVGQKRGFFIGLRRDQLGARLLMMLNSIRLAEDYNTDFRINWFPRGAAAPKLNTPLDLFAASFIERHFIDNTKFENLDSMVKPIWGFLNDKTPDRLEAHLASGGHVLLDEGFEIVTFPWEDGEELQKRFRGFITQIGFNSLVMRHMAEIDMAMSAGSRRVIAYHIRRGDILNEDPWKHKEWPSKIEPDELYSAYLEKNADAGALVFSDQPESIARFTAAHPQVRSIVDLVNLDDCNAVQRDLLELFAMSRASQIVAPPISAFSRAAARLSGQERKCFHEVMDIPERDAAYDNVTARLTKGVAQFITPSEAAHIYVKAGRWLQEAGRESEAWEIGQSILDAGADNAFLPLFHAVNGIYLSKWDKALDYVSTAIADPNQWQENYVTALAVHAHILGALGKPSRARKSFLRAFWQKPMLPDVTVIGSFMLRRGRLRPGAILPFDHDTVMALPVKYLLHNIVLQQNKILKRRALDLSTIAIEWPWFPIDGKTQRLLYAKPELNAMRTRLEAHETYVPGAGPFSFCALLDARMGNLDAALAQNTQALAHSPTDPLVRKRQAEILMLRGSHDEALKQMDLCMSHAPDHAFWHFLKGIIHENAGDQNAARTFFERASKMDYCTAELHAHLAELCREMGDFTAAATALERAVEIAPNQKRYLNRRERILRKNI